MDSDALPYDEGDGDDEEEEEKGGPGKKEELGQTSSFIHIFLSFANLFSSNHHTYKNCNCCSDYQKKLEDL